MKHLGSGHQYFPMVEHVTYMVAIDTVLNDKMWTTTRCHALLFISFARMDILKVHFFLICPPVFKKSLNDFFIIWADRMEIFGPKTFINQVI